MGFEVGDVGRRKGLVEGWWRGECSVDGARWLAVGHCEEESSRCEDR